MHFTLLLVLALVVRASSPPSSYCPSDEQSCYTSQLCHWNPADSRCVSSIPCALEQDITQCELNTWGCTWQANACMRSSRRQASNSPCSAFRYQQAACAQDKRCFWQNFECQLKPTIVLSLADDLGWYDIGWNNPRARTPVLDGMRKMGMGLDRHYGSRFCAPSRGMLLTGKYAWRLGMQTDLNLNPVWNIRCAIAPTSKLLPQVLKETGGYATLGFGKWHLGHYRDDLIPTQRGFDKWIGYYGGGIEKNSAPEQFYSTRCCCSGNPKSCSPFSVNAKLTCGRASGMVNCTAQQQQYVVDSVNTKLEDTTDLFLAAQAREEILKVAEDVPLFVYLSWSTPHEPVYAAEAYKQSIVKSRPAFGTDATINQYCQVSKRLTHLAMVMTMDYANAMVIDALEEVNRFDTTVFVFLSDNGGNSPLRAGPNVLNACSVGFNYPLRGAKFTWWEGGVRALGFVYSKKYMVQSKRGATFKSLMSATDWRRTLLKAGGVAWGKGVDDDGIDYWSPLSGLGVPSHEQRTELPLQVWKEQSRFVILFQVANDIGGLELHKLIMGNPFSGWGAGNVGTQVENYSHGEIEQPFELPTSELQQNRLDSGFGAKLQCKTYCLYNLDRDPQELNELSSTQAQALQIGLQALSTYQAQYVPLLQSGMCEKGYFATDYKDTMDVTSVAQALKCGAWVPWITANGEVKRGC